LPRPKVEHFALSRQKLPINRIGWLDWWREADKSDGAKQQIGLSGGDLGGLFCFLWLLMCSLFVALLDWSLSAYFSDFQAS
jgi:hypothetical protein